MIFVCAFSSIATIWNELAFSYDPLPKKHKCKKQSATPPQMASKVLLTFATARMFKDALRLMEEGFFRNTDPLPNLELAYVTLGGLQRKLDDLLQCEELERETPLDYNEIHILYAATHMYLAYLSMKNKNSLVPSCLPIMQAVFAFDEAVR